MYPYFLFAAIHHEARLLVSNWAAQLTIPTWRRARLLSVTIPRWQRARLLFQHGIGLDRTLSFGPTNYEQRLHLSE